MHTTNGSDPTAKSTLYTSPITIKTSERLSVVAIDSAGITSNLTRTIYIILG